MLTVLLLLLLVQGIALAQPYPAKRARVIIPYPPGSTPDIMGGTLSTKLQEAFGQPFVVENRTGAGGNIGAEAVAKSPADGHTLLFGINAPAAINSSSTRTSPTIRRDLLPVSLLASAPQMLVVTPSVRSAIYYSELEPLIIHACVGKEQTAKPGTLRDCRYNLPSRPLQGRSGE